jgi:antitoxin (DNA-binding transcriptional repressor) of toxin-antitoxin stability system
MKRRLRKRYGEISAAEFKAKCLEMIDDIHAGTRNFVIITKRGQPYAKLVPVGSKEKPFYGCMKGLATIHGDLAKPVDVDWNAFK